eukprot:scaffold48_cov311-Pinguiococcus_pyrenoidosus.AAC.328
MEVHSQRYGEVDEPQHSPKAAMCHRCSLGVGGDVFLVADRQTYDLSVSARHFKAEDGDHGGSSQMHGRNGRATVVKVPLGTVVRKVSLRPNDWGDFDKEYSEAGDLDSHHAAICVARGGRGGLGNDIESGGRRGKSLRNHKSPG